jgi:hypothetical protein
MKMNTRIFRIGLINLFLLISFMAYGVAGQRVHAKIGIEIISAYRVRPAKLHDHLKAGDKLRLYIVPKTNSYVYVVYSDKDTVALLNHQQEQRMVKKDSTLILPSSEAYYEIDGASQHELFTIICSPEELKEVSTLFNSANVSYASWANLEGELIEKSKIDLTEGVDKPPALAGNVREPKIEPTFPDTIPILTGRSLVVKRYEFRVEK